ncbi:MAG: 5-(carboxyamino)imidazole ribonucleotide synthase [Alphaproteobacteria bacterium]|nr:5-(carboxyamino)imidazole ribonucleotide synthase [Alphaproteobacteria bacterium]
MDIGEGFPIVPPGGSIGIVGGGQLGRMMAAAASRIGLSAHIYADAPGSPASFVAASTCMGSFDDTHALSGFAAGVDVLTYEFENVPAGPLASLALEGVAVAPNVEVLRVAQDRLIEKTFANELGAVTAPFRQIDSPADIVAAARDIGGPTILKTRRLGYDGKGQVRLPSIDDGLDATAADDAWREVAGAPCILEGMIDFDCEISIIGARGRNGEIAIYDAPRNVHRGGILRTSIVPANVPSRSIKAGRQIVTDLLERLDYVGVIAVEFFVQTNGDLLVNELAPRVHNSGHWTEDACVTGQFEQHIRAVAGWPLGSTRRFANAEMINLIGDDVATWRDHAADPFACVRLYGKDVARAGRKMGHVTRLVPIGG